MSGKQPPPGLSVIEQMAARHHEKLGYVTRWDRLLKVDQKRLIDAMEAAVEIIPDRLTLKHGAGTDTAKTGNGRDALLADHRHAKTSVLYGR